MYQDKLENSESKASLGNIKSRIIYHRLLGASCASLAVFLLAFTLAPTLISEASATTATAAVTWKSITLTLDPDYAATLAGESASTSTHGDINFGEIIPSSRDTDLGNYGTQKVVKKTINITTEGNYYAVYLSTTSDSNSLSTSGDTTQSIPAIGATSSSPAAFSTTSWGYAIPTVADNGAAYTTPFDSAMTGLYNNYDSFLASTTNMTANNLTSSGTGSSVYNTGTWSAIPTLATTEQVYKNSTTAVSGFDTGDTFDIYYSIMADTNTMSGTYENEIIYTAIASSSSLDTASQNVSRDKDVLTSYSGETETLSIDLASNLSLSTSSVKVYLVPHATILTESYDTANLTATDFPECTVSSVSSESLSATIVCTAPLIGATGSTDTTSTNAIVENGTYDFWIKVTAPDGQVLDYLSHYTDGTNDIASVSYATGLQSETTSGNKVITTMQSMTGAICENTTAYDSSSSSATTFSLTDTRDNNSYSIRKLNDTCWMTSDLIFKEQNLNPTDSDVAVATNLEYQDFSTGTTSEGARTHYETDDYGITRAWYNYPATTALTIRQTTLDGSEPEYSICPKNWRLPTAGELGLFKNRELMTDFTPTDGGGYFLSTAVSTINAYYWSSSIRDTEYFYDLRVSEGITGSDDKSILDLGNFIRCVARD